MAVDTLFSNVRLLMQGGSTTNAAPPSGARGLTPLWFPNTPAPVGSDHVVMTGHGFEAYSGDGSTFNTRTNLPPSGSSTSWIERIAGCYELDVELNPLWPVGAPIAYLRDVQISVESPGVLRWRNGYALNGITPVATGTVNVGADTTRLKIASTFDNTGVASTSPGAFFPAFTANTLPSKLHFKRPGQAAVVVDNNGCSPLSLTNVLRVNNGSPGSGLPIYSPVTPAEFTATIATTQVGYAPAGAGQATETSLFMSSWYEANNNQFIETHWLTGKMTPVDANNQPVGPAITAILPSIAGFTPIGALSFVAQSLAGQIPGAFVVSYSWAPSGTLTLGNSGPIPTFQARVAIYARPTVPGGKWIANFKVRNDVLADNAFGVNPFDYCTTTQGATPVYGNLGQNNQVSIGGIYEQGSGLETIQRLIVTRNIPDNVRLPVYAAGVSSSAFTPPGTLDLTAGGQFQQWVANTYSSLITVTGAAPASNQLVLTITSKAKTSTPIISLGTPEKETIPLAMQQAITKLYGVRVTEGSTRLENGDLPWDDGPPWPVTSIPTAGGGGGGTPTVWDDAWNGNDIITNSGRTAEFYSYAGGHARTVHGKTSGLWYFEVDLSDQAGAGVNYGLAGVIDSTALATEALAAPNFIAPQVSWYATNGSIYVGDVATGVLSCTTPLIVGIELNAGTRQVRFHTNNGTSSQYTLAGTGAIFGAFSSGASAAAIATINAGQAAFVYGLPSGASPWGSSSADASTALLMHFNEASGTTLADETGRTFTTTAVSAITTASGKFGRGVFPASNAWSGAAGNSPVNISGGVFTIEFFLARRGSGATAQYEVVFAQTNNPTGWSSGVVLYVNGIDNYVQAYLGGVTTNSVAIGSAAGVWQHVALVRTGSGAGQTKWYVDGVGGAGFTTSYDHSNVNPHIGDSGPAIGYTLNSVGIDELRISNVARYTANFTPPAAPFTIGGSGAGYRYYHLAGFDLPGAASALWLSELQLWESDTVRANGVAWHATVGTNQGYPPSDGILEDGDLTTASTSFWSTDFISYPGVGLNPDLSLNYDLGTVKLATGLKFARPGGGSTPPDLAGMSFDVYGSNAEFAYSPSNQTTWTFINRVTIQADPAPGVLSPFIEFYSAPPSVADVTGAGYNDIEDFTSTGTGNQQANVPEAYGSSDAVLDDFTADIVAYLNAADITGTGSATLAAATNVGSGVAATPTNITGDPTGQLDDFTSDGNGVSDFPLEFTADYTLEDFTSAAVALFLAPIEGSSDVTLDDAGNSFGAGSLIDPIVFRLNAALPAVTLSANVTQFLVRATVPAATLRAEVSRYEGFKLDSRVPIAALASRFGIRVDRDLPRVTIQAAGTIPNTLRLNRALPRVAIRANIIDGRKLNVNASVPVAGLSAWTGWQLAGVVPAASVSGSIVVGGAYRLDAALPVATSAGLITGMNVLSLAGTVPVAARANWLALSRGVPAVRLVASISEDRAITRLAYSFTMANSAMTRYPAYPFIQVIRMGNAYYGVADDGLYEIGGETDNGAAIPWAWETCMTDFGKAEKKTVVSAYLGGYVPQTMAYTIKAGDSPSGVNAHATTATAVLRNHRQKFGIGRKSRFFAFGLSAAQGRVAIESIEFEVANMSRRV